MFSHSIRHLESTGKFLASRTTGSTSGGIIKPVIKHYDMRVSYDIDEANGSALKNANGTFPNGTYDELNYTPTKTNCSFAGWDKILSSEMVSIEYLETSGTQYINTGIKAKRDINYDVTFQSTTTTTENYFILGARQAMGSNENCLRYRSANGKMTRIYARLYNQDCEVWKNTSETRNNVSKVVKNGGVFTCGTYTVTKSTSDFTTNVDMLLFAMLQANGQIQVSPGIRIFRCKLYDGETLVRDFVPIRIGTEGCMYDMVSKSIFRNDGTGDFIKGTDTTILPFEEVNPSDSIVYDIDKVEAKWTSPTTITFDATTNGGQMPPDWVSPNYYVGKPFGILPVPTASSKIFSGWYTPYGEMVTKDTIVSPEYNFLIAKYMDVAWNTSYSCTTTSEYKNTGIYDATRASASNPIAIDWGDGNIDFVNGNISQLTHTYSSVGTYTVRLSNVKSVRLSINSETWYASTSQNKYTLKQMLAWDSSITSLLSYTFCGCESLSSMVFPSSLTAIPNYCFQNCTSLTNITIPSAIAIIGEHSFRNCGLRSITIPSAVTNIKNSAFNGCKYLTNITFESSNTELVLGQYAFSQVGNLAATGYTIDMSPRTVSAFPTYLFGLSYYLKGLVFPQGITSIEQNAFRQCFLYSASTGSIEIPEGVTTMSATSIFYDCRYLTSVKLPSTLSSIGENCFNRCLRITAITCDAPTAPSIGGSTTFGNSSDSYTGRNSYSTGTNKLIVPTGATGYNTGYWADPLQNANKCGFTLSYQQQSRAYPAGNTTIDYDNHTTEIRFSIEINTDTVTVNGWDNIDSYTCQLERIDLTDEDDGYESVRDMIETYDNIAVFSLLEDAGDEHAWYDGMFIALCYSTETGALQYVRIVENITLNWENPNQSMTEEDGDLYSEIDLSEIGFEGVVAIQQTGIWQ